LELFIRPVLYIGLSRCGTAIWGQAAGRSLEQRLEVLAILAFRFVAAGAFSGVNLLVPKDRSLFWNSQCGGRFGSQLYDRTG
jgi:hypothetical protein